MKGLASLFAMSSLVSPSDMRTELEQIGHFFHQINSGWNSIAPTLHTEHIITILSHMGE